MDDYLCQITDNIYSKPLHSKNILINQKFDNILILMKHPNSEFLNQLKSKSIVLLSDILK